MVIRRLPSAVCRPIGGVAQLGERLLCKQEVVGSIPIASTRAARRARAWWAGIRRPQTRKTGSSRKT